MEFNPRSAEFRANPYPVYHRLRAQDPIHYRHEQGDWILTRYADIVTLLKDNRIGHRDEVEPEGQAKRQPGKSNTPAKNGPHPQPLPQLWGSEKRSPSPKVGGGVRGGGQICCATFSVWQ